MGRVEEVQVIGAGPAGSAAAISALRLGASVTLFEKSTFPRHKVCGEFLSPEAAVIFERLGILDEFCRLQPVRINRVELIFNRSAKEWRLPEAAFGISRYELDRFLLESAQCAGVRVVQEKLTEPVSPAVIAHGRQIQSRRGNRLFGFKAHYRGSSDDLLKLVFSGRVYMGISPVETGETNVCGLAPEAELKAAGFDPAVLIDRHPVLREQARGLEVGSKWLITGPLAFGDRSATRPLEYRAGDALGFVDPFTGSGMLIALATGALAGEAAARRGDAAAHVQICRTFVAKQFWWCALIRSVLQLGLAGSLAPFISGNRLFALTRPRLDHRAMSTVP